MKDQFANYVVQKILEISNDKQREVLLNRIRVHLHALKKYTYGKHIVARFEQLSGEGAHKNLFLFFFHLLELLNTWFRLVISVSMLSDSVVLCHVLLQRVEALSHRVAKLEPC